MKILRSTIVAFASFGISTALVLCGAFTYLENKTYDSRTSLCPQKNTSTDNICFIAVDQESIDWAQKEKGWGWPWPRAAYGDMVRYLTAGNADSIMFDILFTEPSVYGNADDASFANACKDSGRVVQTMYVPEEGADDEVLFPIDSIKESAALIGNITSAKDNDDVIRRARLSFTHDGKSYPTLGTAPYVIKQFTLNNNTEIETNTVAETNDKSSFTDSGNVTKSLTLLSETVPLQKDGTVLLRYRPSVDDYIPY